jgi:hypothetical protein
MHYKSMVYQLNSLRLGLIHEDNIYGKPTIFLAMGSQSPDTKPHVDYYKDLQQKGEYNIIAMPFDNNGTEPGDDYEIVAHYENILGISFYVTEKMDASHQFFKDFGIPTNHFTEYHFDDTTKFVRKV